MDKQQLASKLDEHHHAFITKIESLSDEEFIKKPNDKWTTGQQLEHIIKSVRPVNLAFALPKFALKTKFGSANRPSRAYDALVAKYVNVLEAKKDYVLPKSFAPKEIDLGQRTKKIKKLQKLVRKLGAKLSRFTEEELDFYILPHPVLGKLTLREMVYFTIYHVQHHDRQILENLGHGQPKD